MYGSSQFFGRQIFEQIAGSSSAGYGVFAILISVIVSPVLTGQLSSPLTNPIAVVAVLITNAIWGALVGVCALALQAMMSRANQQQL